MKLTPRIRPLVAAVRAHATENYNSGGWDVIVECYDDEAIAKVIGRARTAVGALAKFAAIIDVVADRQAEAAYQIREALGSDDPTAWRVEDFEAGDLIQVTKNGTKLYVTGTTADAVKVDAVNGQPRSYPGWRVVTRQRGGRKGETLSRRPVDPPKPVDTSVVSCSYTHDGELTSATRTWPGKVGYGVINVYHYDDNEPAEHYVPGWRGQIIDTPDYCGHRGGGKSPGCWDCGDSLCNTKAHPECEPPF